MAPDLEKATRALEAGRPDEAAVFLWSALQTADEADLPLLARLAARTSDARLVAELERKGVRPVPEVDPPRNLRRLRRTLAVAAWLLIGGLWLVGQALSVEEPPRPTVRDATAGSFVAPPVPLPEQSVYLVPLGRLETVDVGTLAAEVRTVLAVRVIVMPTLELPLWTVDASDRQLVAERLLDLLRRAFVAPPGAAVVGLTDFDMYYRNKAEGPFSFSYRDGEAYGVVSAARLDTSLLDRALGRTRTERVLKLVARNVEILYFDRPYTADPTSVRRRSIDSVAHIDEIELVSG